mmetsp:Transcript_29494/g.60444  ORF Transcript_29494/g.60444 Transcript_29494/m.60444 type:complete len:221 (-) Transcript_29494:2385-3047(-)
MNVWNSRQRSPVPLVQFIDYFQRKSDTACKFVVEEEMHNIGCDPRSRRSVRVQLLVEGCFTDKSLRGYVNGSWWERDTGLVSNFDDDVVYARLNDNTLANNFIDPERRQLPSSSGTPKSIAVEHLRWRCRSSSAVLIHAIAQHRPLSRALIQPVHIGLGIKCSPLQAWWYKGDPKVEDKGFQHSLIHEEGQNLPCSCQAWWEASWINVYFKCNEVRVSFK